MNQDQVKDKLLQIDDQVEDFTLIFSGKTSTRVDGLYHPEKQEIIIHNRNFDNDNNLMYTAIHEFAHHVQFTRHKDEVTSRAHTVLFWNIFHGLLSSAEEKGIYENIFEKDPRFIELTQTIKNNYMAKNGEIMKEFGKILIQALDLCQQNHAIFEDFVDRALGMNRNSAKSIMKVFAMDLNPEIGFDNMKIVAGIKNPEVRTAAVESFQKGETQEQVKQQIAEKKPEKDPSVKQLKSQKKRLEENIEKLKQKIADLEMQIEEMDVSGE